MHCTASFYITPVKTGAYKQ